MILAREPMKPTRLSTVVQVICTSLLSGVFPAGADARLLPALAEIRHRPFNRSVSWNVDLHAAKAAHLHNARPMPQL